MGSKPFSGSNPILVDDTEASKSIKLVVLVGCKRKGVERLEPSVIGISSVLRVSRDDLQAGIGGACGGHGN